MRALLIFIVGLLAGAALFHTFYLEMTPATRCAWDHPFDSAARESCAAATFRGYAPRARRQMDRLIDEVSH